MKAIYDMMARVGGDYSPIPPLDAPPNLTVVAVSNSSISLSWGAVDTAVG
jgi:hypothetical protein